MKPQIKKKNDAYVSFITKWIIFIIKLMYIYFFSEENSLICSHLEEVCFFLIACFQGAIRRHIFRMQSHLSVNLFVQMP